MNEQELRDKIARIIAKRLCKNKYSHFQLYGDSANCYSRENFAECEVIADTVDALIAAEIGDVSEYKHRTEVAEKERNEWERKTEIAQKAGKIIQRDMLRIFGSENPVINDKINALWDLALQQAEREIEENALRQALLTVEEDMK